MTLPFQPRAFSAFFSIPAILIAALLALSACTTNPATGEQQFTGLLPAGQEAQVGASEHEKIRAAYGGFMQGNVATYVSNIGQKIARNTERQDVNYQFFVLDSSEVNAFALPGGYIYISRGLLTLADDEAELAGVLAHEIGHVTGRHAAARTSQGALVGIGAAILGAATGSNAVGQIASTGGDLYVRSYSRGQESEADTLGVRYLTRAGYDPAAMADFLTSLERQTQLEAKLAGREGESTSAFLSTHPLTSDRIRAARAEAQQYPQSGVRNRDQYLTMVDGLTYGDSAAQGFVSGNTFYHPQMGFAFDVPQGFNVQNGPREVVAAGPGGAAIIFDAASGSGDPAAYLRNQWFKDAPLSGVEAITINGMRAATGALAGTANGRPVTVRAVAIEWQPGRFYRFQMAIPQTANSAVIDELRRTTYSFRRLNQSEVASLRPLQLDIFTAGPGDSVQARAARMPFSSYQVERFQVLNGLNPGEGLQPGRIYKTVIQ